MTAKSRWPLDLLMCAALSHRLPLLHAKGLTGHGCFISYSSFNRLCRSLLFYSFETKGESWIIFFLMGFSCKIPLIFVDAYVIQS